MTTKNLKWEDEKGGLVEANKDNMLLEEKKDYFIYEKFYINLMVTIKQKSRAET